MCQVDKSRNIIYRFKSSYQKHLKQKLLKVIPSEMWDREKGVLKRKMVTLMSSVLFDFFYTKIYTDMGLSPSNTVKFKQAHLRMIYSL